MRAAVREAVGAGCPVAEGLAITDGIETLGTAAVAGRTIAVTGSNDGTTRLWDLPGGRQIGDPVPGALCAVTETAGTPVALTTARDDGIRVWDLTMAAR